VAADRAKSNALTAEQRERARTLFEHAFELLQSADDREARLGFEQGLAIDPGNTVANLYLAESLVRLGDDERARTFFNKVVALDPGSAEASQAQVALGELDAARIDADNRIVVVAAVEAPFKTLAGFETYQDELLNEMEVTTSIRCAGSLSNAETSSCGPDASGTWSHGVYLPVPIPREHFKCYRPEASASCIVAQRIAKKLAEKIRVSPQVSPMPHDTILGLALTDKVFKVNPPRLVFDVAVFPMASALQPIRDGELRAIAVTGAARSPNLPQVPTLAESGVSGF
jgi:hypothetical protein